MQMSMLHAENEELKAQLDKSKDQKKLQEAAQVAAQLKVFVWRVGLYVCCVWVSVWAGGGGGGGGVHACVRVFVICCAPVPTERRVLTLNVLRV